MNWACAEAQALLLYSAFSLDQLDQFHDGQDGYCQTEIDQKTFRSQGSKAKGSPQYRDQKNAQCKNQGQSNGTP